MDLQHIQKIVFDVLETEASAIASLKPSINSDFFHACEILLACQGHIALTGIGKSGYIAAKIAATLSSTGSPALYMNAAEASHGDMGMLRGNDVLMALSYSGESDEIKSLLPAIKQLNIKLIAITGSPASSLANAADICIDVRVAREACPLGLAPTASTTAMLAIGDAFSAVLLDARGFSHHDFAQTHPGGKLGRRLLLHLSDIMHREGDIPKVDGQVLIADALYEMSKKRLGMTLVCNATDLVGIFTDGDLRRVINKRIDLQTTPIKAVMSKNFYVLYDHQLAIDALALLEEKKVNSAPVLNTKKQLVGALNLHDLLRAGI